MAAMHDPDPAHDADANPFRLAENAAIEIQSRTGGVSHDVAVVLGSGWAEASIGLGPADSQMFTNEIVGFVASTVEGHRGTIYSLTVGSSRVLLFLGRVHLYEGNPRRRGARRARRDHGRLQHGDPHQRSRIARPAPTGSAPGC
jgi:hypothetical protein